MGHNPIPPRRQGITVDAAAYRLARATGTDSERFHLGRIREAYARDVLGLDVLERAIEHVLRGGYVDENFLLRAPVMDRVRRRRQQRDCPHFRLYEFVSGSGERMEDLCADCGARL